MSTVLSYLSAAISVIATLIFLWITWQNRESKPSKVTWLCWTLLTIVTATGMWQDGSLSIQMVAIVLCDVAIVGFALLWGKKGWSWLDLAVFGVSIAGAVILWQMQEEKYAALAVVLGTLFMCIIGAIPMCYDLVKNPLAENPLPYAVMGISSIVQLLAVLTSGAITFTGLIQPIVYLGVQYSIWRIAAPAWLAKWAKPHPLLRFFFLV